MSYEQDALYRLLPAHIRSRDDAGEGPLKELLRIVGRHSRLLGEDIRQRMYDDWFIETCQDWVVPYIGDLLGYERMPARAAESRTSTGRRLAKVLSPRREIGNLIAYRRRKGTLWLLEELARDVANWPARAVEFYRLLSRSEHLDHLQSARPAFAEIRDAGKLDLTGSPFDTLCHTADVRRISSKNSPGRYNIPHVGLFVFRSRRYSVTKTSAYCREDIGPNCFTFSILGHDAPLFRLKEPESEPTSLAEEANFELPIRRRALAKALDVERVSPDAANSLFGEEKSLVIYARDWPSNGAGLSSEGQPLPIDAKQVFAADLIEWNCHVPTNHVAVDPVLGRIKFPKGQAPKKGVLVSYGYGFLADIGGGEYDRPALPLPAARNHFFVDPELDQDKPREGWFRTIDAAYQYWRSMRPAKENGVDNTHTTWRPAAVIELAKSGVYKGRIDFALNEGEFVCVMAGERARPIIWLTDENVGGPDALSIRGGKGARVVFDGILVTGRGVTITGGETLRDNKPLNDADLCEVVFRHSTLVPGWSLHGDCKPRRASEPSITVENTSTRIRVESSIVGAIRIDTDSRIFEPTSIVVCDSIVDATSDSRVAIGSSESCPAYAELRIARSSVVGEVIAHAIRLAENSIFTAPVRVARRQLGCIRYSFVPLAGSRTPQRYRCQPDEALARLQRELQQDPKSVSLVEDELSEETLRRVAPCFESLRYGTRNYMRLCGWAAPEIKTGADDESEMGVYHDLFEPKRLALLTRRLEEFVPASTDTAIMFAS